MLTSYEEYCYLTEAAERKASQMWEIARWIEYHQTLLSPYLKAGQKPKKPSDVISFPWDKKNEAPRISRPLTAQEELMLHEMAMAFMNNQTS